MVTIAPGHKPRGFCYNIRAMQRLILVLLVGLLIAATANYVFGSFSLPCHLPVRYSIGQFDDRFGLDRSEAIAALAEAEAIWESAIGSDDLFVYDEEGSVLVNFIYDERQQEVDAASSALDDLDLRGDANQVLVELHAKLVAEYEANEAEYEAMRASYDADLIAYNADVARYNESGGAPPDVYAELERTKDGLDTRRAKINTLGDKLNNLSERINEISTKGNELIYEYNQRVNAFNDTFVHEEEFTQGDYQGRRINIYTFESHSELVLVLAHEFGHALSLGHVNDPQAIMYYLMGEQPVDAVTTEADLIEYSAICEANMFEKLWAVYNGR